jgi:hypothetical protein
MREKRDNLLIHNKEMYKLVKLLYSHHLHVEWREMYGYCQS